MAKTVVPDLGIVLAFIRDGQGWSQTRLARAADTDPNVINDYEHGRKRLTRPRLEKLLAEMAVPPERIEATLACLEGNRASSRAPAEPDGTFAAARRRIGAVSTQAGRLAEEFSRRLLQLLSVEGEALQGEQAGELLWRRLKAAGRTAAQRRMLVEDVRKYRHWGLAVRVAAESIEKAANHPREALELAELSLYIAERVPGDALWRTRLAGIAGVHVANGHRVCNDMHAMEVSLKRGLVNWEEGAPGDPGILNPAVVPWIEAACRRAQRRFKEARKKIDEALELDRGELRGKILLSKSAILAILGDQQGMTEVLDEAAPLIDERQEPRDALMLRFNLIVGLAMTGRSAEAEPRLREVRRLAERLGELGLVRVVWLDGKLATELGRFREAESALKQVRRDFEARGLAFDYALVSMDLALLLLKEGRSAEVREVTEEMICIFKTQDIQREAFVALQLFCEAARRESASVELAQRVIRYLHRAQLDPGLRFEESTEPVLMRAPAPDSSIDRLGIHREDP